VVPSHATSTSIAAMPTCSPSVGRSGTLFAALRIDTLISEAI